MEPFSKTFYICMFTVTVILALILLIIAIRSLWRGRNRNSKACEEVEMVAPEEYELLVERWGSYQLPYVY